MFKMIDTKSVVTTDTIDGNAVNYQLEKIKKEECFNQVKTAQQKGTLNPVIVNTKKAKKIDDFFKTKEETFIKRESETKTKPKKTKKMTKK